MTFSLFVGCFALGMSIGLLIVCKDFQRRIKQLEKAAERKAE